MPVPRLRADRVDQREDRPARSGACWRPRSTSGASAASAIPTGELNRLIAAAARPHAAADGQAAAGRRSSTRPRSPSRRRRSCSSPATPAASTSATGATSRTGCASPSGSTGRRSAWSSASGPRSSSSAASASRRASRRRRQAVAVALGGGLAATTHRPMTAGARTGSGAVAVVGAGAWGTTLAALLAAREPVTLLVRTRPETAERDRRDERGTSARLPGIDLPPPDPGHRRSRGAARRPRPGRLRGAVAAPAGDGRARRRRRSPPSADLLSVVKGLEHGTLLRMTRGHRRCRRVRADADRGAVGPEPRARDRARPAGVGGRRGRGPRARARGSSSGSARREFRLYVNRDVLGVELVRRAEEHHRDRRRRGRPARASATTARPA